MQLHKTRAIVGPAFDVKEKGRLFRLLTPELGRVAAMAHGTRDLVKGTGGWLQPLAEVEVTLAGREGAEVLTIRDGGLLDAHAGLQTPLSRLAVASLFVDFAIEASAPNSEAHQLYELLLATLRMIEEDGDNHGLIAAAHGFVHMLGALGSDPQIDPALLDGSWKRTLAPHGDTAPPKPKHFLLLLDEGRICAPVGPTAQTAAPSEAAGNVRVLGPGSVRLLHETQSMTDFSKLTPAHPRDAILLIDALIDVAHWHLRVSPKSIRFWRETVVGRVK